MWGAGPRPLFPFICVSNQSAERQVGSLILLVWWELGPFLSS